MKKVIVILLCVALLCSLLCACQDKEEILKVGYGRADVTPTESVAMRGYGNPESRWSQEVRDPLYATCIAFTDGYGNSCFVFSLDYCSFPVNSFSEACLRLSEETGVPYENFIGSATHNHFSPEATFDERWANTNWIKYWATVTERIYEAGMAAWNDRAEATMSYSTTEVTGLNFVRHYIMDDGSVDAGNNTGTGTTRVDYTSKADQELQTVRICREGKKDIVMVNFQAHPQRYYWEGLGGDDTTITADTVGATRDYVEAYLDCDFMYITGASGNLNPYSFIESDNIAQSLAEYGEKLGKQVILSTTDMEALSGSRIALVKQEISGVKEKPTTPATVFCVGDLAFVSVSYEMFDTNGSFIKENSPFDATFIMYLSSDGDGVGYVAAEGAYDYGGYEVEYRNYPKGSAELLADGYVGMLKQLHEGVTGGQGNG